MLSIPLFTFSQNFSNKGKEFWVGYGHNHLFNYSVAPNSQQMILYLSAEQPANVKVSINGTSWVKTYSIPANTVIPSDLIPKTGAEDCRLLNEGLSDKGIHIESDVPIVAYAHVYGQNSSGAAMLLPVESYGYTYVSLNSEQNYEDGCYSWFFVVASENNTTVRITPSKPTVGGKPQGVPFDINLKKGQIYNVMGLGLGNGKGNDMSGSKIQSIEGTDGVCHPIGVFSGSSRSYICPVSFGGGGDFIMQEVFPVSAWGMQYLTAVTSSSLGPSVLNNNKFRVYVKDVNTLVRRNGALLSGITNNSFYEFSSSGADNITANKPIMVAQFIPSSGACSTTGDGDPEMFYLSPLEQAINKASFYNTTKEAITTTYLTMIVPNGGLPSLRIDGNPTVDYSYAHPNLAGYTVVVKKMPTQDMQHTIQSDSAFTAITYGLGYVESYGYNTGTYVNNLTTISQINNVQSQNGATNTYTCPKTPFKISIKTIYQPSSLTWQFSKASHVAPSQDVTVNNPVSSASQVINGKTYYTYEFDKQCFVDTLADVTIPVIISDMNIDNCSHEELVSIRIPVQKGPQAQFSVNEVCAGDTAYFKDATTGIGLSNWNWKFGDATTSTAQNPSKLYNASGKYDVNFTVVRTIDGCIGDTTGSVGIHVLPTAAFKLPDAICMPGGTATFNNQSTINETNSQLQYTWNFGDGNSSNDQNGSHTYTAAKNYAVSLIARSSFGCADTAIQTLSHFVDKPVASFDIKETILCEGSAISFINNSKVSNAEAAKWEWSFGDGTRNTVADPLKTFTGSGSYPVTLTVNEEGCVSDEASQTVAIHKKPLVDAGPDVLTEPARPVTLQANVDDASATIQWTPAQYLSSATIIRPQASPMNSQEFYITATNAEHCSSTDSVLVKVFRELKIPNAFSPNGDGVNDKWNIPGLADYQESSVEVYNRWGQVVFRSKGYSVPWDGTFNGSPLPVGAYYYIIAPNAKGYGKLSGSVVIVR